MTRPILWKKPHNFEDSVKSTVLANEPFFVGVWRLDDSADIGSFMRNAARALKSREGPGGTKRLAFLNASCSVLSYC